MNGTRRADCVKGAINNSSLSRECFNPLSFSFPFSLFLLLGQKSIHVLVLSLLYPSFFIIILWLVPPDTWKKNVSSFKEQKNWSFPSLFSFYLVFLFLFTSIPSIVATNISLAFVRDEPGNGVYSHSFFFLPVLLEVSPSTKFIAVFGFSLSPVKEKSLFFWRATRDREVEQGIKATGLLILIQGNYFSFGRARSRTLFLD